MTLGRLTGTGSGGDLAATAPFDKFNRARGQVVKETLDVLMAGDLGRNRFVGGGQAFDLDGSATGTLDLQPWVPFGIDNRGNRLSDFSDANGASLIVQVRFLLWVSNGAINVTPKIYDITAAALATTSGGAACAATSIDYGGTNQQQTLTLTLPNAHHYFKPQLTIAGTPDSGYLVRGTAIYDCYVALP